MAECDRSATGEKALTLVRERRAMEKIRIIKMDVNNSGILPKNKVNG